MDAITTIIENGDRITSYVLLLLFLVGILWGLSTNRLEIGSSVKEKDEALKEAKQALDSAEKELMQTKLDYVRLQVERDYYWRSQLPTSNPQVIPQTPEKGGQ